MCVCQEVAFPYTSEFTDNTNTLTLDDWIWKRKDNLTNFSFDSLAEKIWAIKKCYQECSKKTGYIFYLPILKDSSWQITKYKDGKESVISLEEFKKGF